MSLSNIHNILNLQLSNIGGLPTIYYPNTQNEPVQGTNWLRPTLLPASGELYTLNSGNYHHGIYQVDIFTPLKKGLAGINTIADTIRDGYKGQSLSLNNTTVHIQNINISLINIEESWCHCFVEINYYCID